MLNRIQELIDELNGRPNSAEGFSAKEMYTEGMKFGLTCKEVKETFLGKEKALGRGKYPATVTDAILETAKTAPLPAVKAPKPKAAAKRNVSTKVTLEKVEITKEAKEKRRDLIKKIAKRHRDEDAVVNELTKNAKDAVESEDDGTAEEFAKISGESA